jgi:hypothetical protein
MKLSDGGFWKKLREASRLMGWILKDRPQLNEYLEQYSISITHTNKDLIPWDYLDESIQRTVQQYCDK